MPTSSTTTHRAPALIGQLAKEYANKRLPLTVLQTAAGYYIGTADNEGPCSRESAEYWPTMQKAEEAFSSGDWTQRDTP